MAQVLWTNKFRYLVLKCLQERIQFAFDDVSITWEFNQRTRKGQQIEIERQLSNLADTCHADVLLECLLHLYLSYRLCQISLKLSQIAWTLCNGCFPKPWKTRNALYLYSYKIDEQNSSVELYSPAINDIRWLNKQLDNFQSMKSFSIGRYKTRDIKQNLDVIYRRSLLQGKCFSLYIIGYVRGCEYFLDERQMMRKGIL